jgi:hypothetical protein
MLAVEQRWKRKQLVKELSTLYRVHADFDHLGIVKFNGATYQEGTALIVLEYMNRGSLLSLIEEYGKIEEKFLKPIAKQVGILCKFKFNFSLGSVWLKISSPEQAATQRFKGNVQIDELIFTLC